MALRVKICELCGSAFLAHPAQKFCSTICARTKRIIASRVQLRRPYRRVEHPLIQCCDCGELVPRKSTLTKRCHECSIEHQWVQYGTYVAIQVIRQRFSVLATVSPKEALAIVEDMDREEGPEFTELALDGLPAVKGIFQEARSR